MKENQKIDYRYLDVDNEVLYKSHDEYKKALRYRTGTIIERSVDDFESGQYLIAGGTGFTEHEAVDLCKRLSGITI